LSSPRGQRRGFSPFSARAVQIYLGNFAQRFYYEESLSAGEKPVFSLSLRETLILPFSARKRAAAPRRKKSRLYAARKSLGRGAEKPRGFIAEKRVGTLLGTRANRHTDETFPFFFFLQHALG